jgi:hypothetical protein
LRDFQDFAFMHRHVVGFFALDFILRLILAGVMGITLINHIRGVNLDDLATDVPGFRIPGDMIADFEALGPDFTRDVSFFS